MQLKALTFLLGTTALSFVTELCQQWPVISEMHVKLNHNPLYILWWIHSHDCCILSENAHVLVLSKDFILCDLLFGTVNKFI